MDDIHFANLGAQDVVRHQLVGRIVAAYDRADAEREARAAREGKA
nr:PhoH family protein [Corynebacterium camporealensis]